MDQNRGRARWAGWAGRKAEDARAMSMWAPSLAFVAEKAAGRDAILLDGEWYDQ